MRQRRYVADLIEKKRPIRNLLELTHSFAIGLFKAIIFGMSNGLTSSAKALIFAAPIAGLASSLAIKSAMACTALLSMPASASKP